MKRLLVAVFCWLLMPGMVLAADLNTATIRLNRSQNGQSPIPVLVEFRTDNSVVETGIRLTLGQAWSVNGSVKSSVEALPSGVIAVPGINSIGAVNGKEIDFGSSDLVAGVVYGFYITEGISNNVLSTDNNYRWKVATLTGGGIDCQKDVILPVTNSDQLEITGVVAANQSQVELNLGVAQTGNFRQNQKVDFQIDYKSLVTGNLNNFVITASWSRGTVAGSPVPNVDIFDYVPGSATEAYDGVAPVVDSINRTITWTISNYPPNLGTKTVYFSLKTNDNYTDLSQVKLEINSSIMISSNTVITKNLERFYQYISPTVDVAGIVPTLGENINKMLEIEKVQIITLNKEMAEIMVVTSVEPEEIRIKYGLSVDGLGKMIVSINKLKEDKIKIENLLPGRTYYFQVEASRNGEIVRSEIYTFTTTNTDQLVAVVPESLIATAQNSVLFQATTAEVKNNVFVIPSRQNYSVKVNLIKPELVKTAKIFVRNANVLGITSVFGAEAPSGETDMMEIGGGRFSGQLKTSNIFGFYEILIRVTDIYGNIFEEIIGYVKVVSPFRVIDINDKILEAASVKIWRFNENNKIYELLPSRQLAPNPTFTNVDGIADLVLPMGRYRAEVNYLNFATKSVDFVVGIGESDGYPEVKMSERILSVSQLVKYYDRVVKDSVSYNRDYFTELGKSTRFLRLVALIQMGMSGIFLLILLEKNFGMRWWLVPVWLMSRIFNRNQKSGIRGRVIDGRNNMGISGADVYLIDGSENKNLVEVKSGVGGYFTIELILANSYKLFWNKDGYEIPIMRDFEAESIKAFLIELPLTKEVNENNWLAVMGSELIKIIFGSWAMVTLFLSYFFIKYISTEAIYFLVIAIFNVILWSVFLIIFNKKNGKIY